MIVKETSLPEVLEITPRIFADSRGFFYEAYNAERYKEFGIAATFVQDNRSKSLAGTVRGLHYQLNNPQAKLVRVTHGEVLDIAVDIRKGSPRFGQWVAVKLSADNHKQLFIPEGFAHGFIVLSKEADFEYKCSDYYHPEDEYGIFWQDPTLKIDWPDMPNHTLSPKDLKLPVLNEVSEKELPHYE
ncbi:dTDP-4-dehydrorhamnose 3,5-epimerase [Zooshikella ganghwensis]|uniref:dTDP-4-dehydrorhamnose 3,5-epimerase n=1 Tax=Zooshikella ganghwensis TaxID=202772 RepID=A0A4P9VH90_9GAMM|nr:dTDP-4-dehydrorhamnose 3,5-epimerase [Zooshikella ganghwensis]RDH42473.1 dTDP-4-dehydrorhamnose 3,5-epimerase [Zooshikella ganghwensis]